MGKLTGNNAQVAVDRELLRLALHNSSRSFALHVAALAVIVWMGLEAGQLLWSVVAVAVGLLTAIWRRSIAVRHKDPGQLDEPRLARLQLELEANAALSGVMWAVATAGVYPALHGTTATTYVGMVFGSITVAAF